MAAAGAVVSGFVHIYARSRSAIAGSVHAAAVTGAVAIGLVHASARSRSAIAGSVHAAVVTGAVVSGLVHASARSRSAIAGSVHVAVVTRAVAIGFVHTSARLAVVAVRFVVVAFRFSRASVLSLPGRLEVSRSRVVVVMVAHAASSGKVHSVVGARIVMAAPAPPMATVAHINSRAVKIVVPISVVVADGVVPSGAYPADGAEKIVDGAEEVVLPVEKYAAQVRIAVFPIISCAVGSRADAHEVVQVDFISSVVLLRCEVEFVCHFICKEPCPLACFLVVHGHHFQ